MALLAHLCMFHCAIVYVFMRMSCIFTASFWAHQSAHLYVCQTCAKKSGLFVFNFLKNLVISNSSFLLWFSVHLLCTWMHMYCAAQWNIYCFVKFSVMVTLSWILNIILIKEIIRLDFTDLLVFFYLIWIHTHAVKSLTSPHMTITLILIFACHFALLIYSPQNLVEY